MTALPFVDVLGFWIGIFLTLAILSFLYKDNPFYKSAEHVFVGVSVGYVIAKQYYDTIKPNLIDRIWVPDTWSLGPGWYWYLFPLVLVVLLFMKITRWNWLGRYPIAFVVSLYAALQVNALANADLKEQVKVTMRPLSTPKVDLNEAPIESLTLVPGISPPVAEKILAERAAGRRFQSLDELAVLPGLTESQRIDLEDARGSIAGLDAQASVGTGGQYWLGLFSKILLVVGLLASLVYFYFSIEQRGVVGKISRVGVWILMIGFGAGFGFTVQGRLALAVGRAMDLLDKNRVPSQAAQIRGPVVSIIFIVLIVIGLILWERRRAHAAGAGTPPRSS